MSDAGLTHDAGLTLDGVSAAYRGVTVLQQMRLTVARGELLVVLGPSGAGKSTLLRVVAGLEPVTTGRVWIAGRDVTADRPGRRNVSMVFQSYALFPHLTVAENIAFGLVVRDVPKAAARARARAAAEQVGAAHLLGRRPGQLSGGERQRVALARALVREPDVFLLDEPLSNLDLALRVQMRAELRALHERLGATMVHVTHDQTEALVLADRIAVLRDGRVEQVGTPDEIWHTPASRFVAGFVGSPAMNVLPNSGPIHPSGAPPAGMAGDREIGFRPEAVVLGEPDGAAATVDRVEVVGTDAYAYLTLRAGNPVVARVPAAHRPARGDAVRVGVRWADTHVFDATTGLRCTA